MKKGNLVQFNIKDVEQPINGIVKSVGKTVKVTYKHPITNNLHQVSCGFDYALGFFKVISQAPALPKGLETLTIKGYNEVATGDGVCFSAKIYYKGKWVATIENGGYGGPTDISPVVMNQNGTYTKNPLAVELFTKIELLFENIDGESLPMCDGCLSYFFENYLLNEYHMIGTNFDEWISASQVEWSAYKAKHSLN